MNGVQEEKSKRAHVFILSVMLINFSGKTSIFVVIHFTSFVLTKTRRNKVALYQKIKVLTPLGADFSNKNN